MVTGKNLDYYLGSSIQKDLLSKHSKDFQYSLNAMILAIDIVSFSQTNSSSNDFDEIVRKFGDEKSDYMLDKFIADENYLKPIIDNAVNFIKHDIIDTRASEIRKIVREIIQELGVDEDYFDLMYNVVTSNKMLEKIVMRLIKATPDDILKFKTKPVVKDICREIIKDSAEEDEKMVTDVTKKMGIHDWAQYHKRSMQLPTYTNEFQKSFNELISIVVDAELGKSYNQSEFNSAVKKFTADRSEYENLEPDADSIKSIINNAVDFIISDIISTRTSELRNLVLEKMAIAIPLALDGGLR